MKQQKEYEEYGMLSIPNELLKEAGIPKDSDLIIETIPGVILIGVENPLQVANQPLLDLFFAWGFEPREEIKITKEGEC